MLDQLKDSFGLKVKLREHIVVEVLPLCLKLPLSEVWEIIISLTYKLFRTNVSIDEQTTACRDTRYPLATRVACLVCTAHWELLALKTAYTTPMRNFQHLNPCHQDLKHTSAKIMRKQDIRIYHEEFRNKCLHQLFFIVEELNVWLIVLFKFLLEIEWPWVAWQAANQTETMYLGCVVCGTILVYLVLDKAWNHGYLVSVVRRSSSFYTKGKGCEWRWWAINLVECDLHVLWVINICLMLTPSLFELSILPGIFHFEPARTLNLPLQNEQF